MAIERGTRQRCSRSTAGVMDVEVWSDVACSWCYLAKRRLAAALAGFEHADQVNVVWRSFELDPAAPAAAADGKSSSELLAEKRGLPLEQAVAMHQKMADIAAEEELDIRFERVRPGSTFDAHRLLHLARAHGVQGALGERLMRAHHTDGELVSDRETLRRLAVEVGVPEPDVGDVLTSDRYAEDVREDERVAAGFGVNSVPFFVVDRAIGAPGALPPEAMLDLLRQGWAAKPRPSAAAEGDACGIDGC